MNDVQVEVTFKARGFENYIPGLLEPNNQSSLLGFLLRFADTRLLRLMSSHLRICTAILRTLYEDYRIYADYACDKFLAIKNKKKRTSW